MEIQMVQEVGYGTRKWSDEELDLLKAGKKVPNYRGHHITSVNADVTKAADHRNIKFVHKDKHKDEHPGGFAKPIFSNDQIDRTLGGSLPDLASKGAKTWSDRAGRAITAFANSRTVRLLDAVDPTVWADEAYRYQFGGGIWSFSDIMKMTPAQRACLGRECA